MRIKPEPAKHQFHRLRTIRQRSIVKESFIIPYHHHGLDLLDRLKHNADHDDQAGSSEGYGSAEHASEEEGEDTDDRKTDRSDKDDIIQDSVKILTCRFAGTDTRDETSALFQIVCNLQRIESDRRIEVREEDQQYYIYDKTE